MRTYLAVVDETPEARVALRFAARRAAKTGGAVLLLAMVPPAEFVHWSGVQAAMAEEERLRVEAMVADAAGALLNEVGLHPEILISHADPVAAVTDVLAARPHIAALVLGAPEAGEPGPLVEHFGGARAGLLPCPLMIVPGRLDAEALDRLS